MYGQVLLGPPGSGKTTFCKVSFKNNTTPPNILTPAKAMKDLLTASGRHVIIVNLDPANGDHWQDEDNVIDLEDLVSARHVMSRLKLGPNASMIFCVEYLEAHVDWLFDRITQASTNHDNAYFLFDLPGQVELVTHHASVANVIMKLQKNLKLQLCAVYLLDATTCYDVPKFISGVLLSLSTMIRLYLPHVNVLSKVDLLDPEALDLPLDFYCGELQDISQLLEIYQHKTTSSSAVSRTSEFVTRHQRLNEAIGEMIESFNLVGFQTVTVQDVQSMIKLAKIIGNALGYVHPDQVASR